jgi:hypothetical protein
VDSVGIVYKFGDSNYFTDWAKERLTEIGIRHLRGALRPASKRKDTLVHLNNRWETRSVHSGPITGQTEQSPPKISHQGDTGNLQTRISATRLRSTKRTRK